MAVPSRECQIFNFPNAFISRELIPIRPSFFARKDDYILQTRNQLSTAPSATHCFASGKQDHSLRCPLVGYG